MTLLVRHGHTTSWVQRVLAAMLFALALPLLAIVALLIYVRAPGPVLFRQAREGVGGRPFGMFKLRTMRCGAELHLQQLLRERADLRPEWEKFGCLRRDPRVAGAMGRFARKFSIDEIPQLLNVTGGDMALVGPRPLPPDIACALPAALLAKRRTVLPGMTGLWQVSGRSKLSLRWMGRLDSLYVRNKSIALDLWILARTLPEVVRGDGAI